MSQQTRLLRRGEEVELGTSEAPLSFTDYRHPGGRRLRLDGVDAVQLSNWCGTCRLLFERLDGAVRTLSSDEFSARLTDGLERIDEELLSTVGSILPPGRYIPLLLDLRPVSVRPGHEGDYFVEEHRRDWSSKLPSERPMTSGSRYYRGGTWHVDTDVTLFEFVVPMVPPERNNLEQVEAHRERLLRGQRPTALALSVVDGTYAIRAEHNHLGLTHMLLDGHHKMQAAADSGLPLRLLSLVALKEDLTSGSLATDEDVDFVLRVVAEQ